MNMAASCCAARSIVAASRGHGPCDCAQGDGNHLDLDFSGDCAQGDGMGHVIPRAVAESRVSHDQRHGPCDCAQGDGLRSMDHLDQFDALVNDLSSGLPAEIKARRQQYEHYRERLLTFREAV